MKLTSAIASICLAFTSGAAGALVGIGIKMYDPACADSCNRAIASNMLTCSSHDHAGGHMHGSSGATTPQCRATDDSFLTTLAYCMNTKCAQYQTPTSKLESFWERMSTGDPTVAPKWDYGTALHHIDEPPTREVLEDDVLNFTAIVPMAAWDIQYQTAIFFEEEETVHARYGVIILVVGFATPIVLTWLGYLPYMTGILERVKPYMIYKTIIGRYHVRPLPYALGNAPTVGQSLYISLMIILNVILTAANYKITDPFAWYSNTHQEVLGFIMFRTGVLAFALAPLVLLFSSRNNILLWLSNWSHSTFLLLHRWIARIFGIQVIIHSIVALVLYIDTKAYPEEEKLPYWIWGAVATVAVSILLVGSGLYIRRLSYEFFLLTHIILAVIVIVGSWYHVEIRFERKWGYETWMYAACAVWFFDRLIRVLRILKTGVRRAKVEDIGDGFVRVDVEGVRWCAAPGRHVYVFFPTLNRWRPWENHPFSVLPTAMLRPSSSHSLKSDESDLAASTEPSDLEKRDAATVRTDIVQDRGQGNTAAGLTLFIRKSTGMTRSLAAHTSLLTLLDGPYPNNSHDASLRCDRILLLGGGIGITGLLPWMNAHENVKLYWSVKASAASLVQAMDTALTKIKEKDVRIGQRLDIVALLREEVEAGWAKIGVVTCGPGGMCDDVRVAVFEAGKMGGAVFELEVDAYSW